MGCLVQNSVVWGQLGLQEGITSIIEGLNYFHDYIMSILIIILFSVTYLFAFVALSPRLDKVTTDSHVLETI